MAADSGDGETDDRAEGDQGGEGTAEHDGGGETVSQRDAGDRRGCLVDAGAVDDLPVRGDDLAGADGGDE